MDVILKALLRATVPSYTWLDPFFSSHRIRRNSSGFLLAVHIFQLPLRGLLLDKL